MNNLAAGVRKNLGHLPLADGIIDTAMEEFKLHSLDNKKLIQVSDHYNVTETDIINSSNDVVLSSYVKQFNVGDNADMFDSNSDGKYKLISQTSTFLTNTSKVISSRQIFSSEDDPKVNKVVDYIYKENKIHLTQIEDDKEAVSSTNSTVSFKVSVRLSSTEATHQKSQSNNVFHEMNKIEYPSLEINENNAVEAKNIFGNTQANENSHSKTCINKYCNCHGSASSTNSKSSLFSKYVTKQDLSKEENERIPSEHLNISGKKQPAEIKKEFIEKPSDFFPCKEPIKKLKNTCSTEDISQNIDANINISTKEKESEKILYGKREPESKLSEKFEREYFENRSSTEHEIGENRKKCKYSEENVLKIMPQKIFRKNVPKLAEKISATVKTSVTATNGDILLPKNKLKRVKNVKNNSSKCTGNSSLKKIKYSRIEDLNCVKNANDYKYCTRLRKKALNYFQFNREIESSTSNIQSNCQKEGNNRILKKEFGFDNKQKCNCGLRNKKCRKLCLNRGIYGKRSFAPLAAGQIKDGVHINKQKQSKIVEPTFDVKLRMMVSVVLEDISKKNTAENGEVFVANNDCSFEKWVTSTKGIRTTERKNVLEQLRADPKLRIEPRVVLTDIKEVQNVASCSFAEAKRRNESCNIRNPNKNNPKEKKLFSKPRRMRAEEIKSLPSGDPKLKMEPCVVLEDINNVKNIARFRASSNPNI